jgi:hypothetical protein
MRLLSFPLVLCVGLTLLNGCRKKVSPQSGENTPPPIEAPAPPPTESAPPATVAPETVTPAPAVDETGMSRGIEVLNIAINDFFTAEGRAPKDLDELVKKKYLVKAPEAPAGQKFVIDPVKRTAKQVKK